MLALTLGSSHHRIFLKTLKFAPWLSRPACVQRTIESPLVNTSFWSPNCVFEANIAWSIRSGGKGGTKLEHGHLRSFRRGIQDNDANGNDSTLDHPDNYCNRRA
jgi:hypothetical protein